MKTAMEELKGLRDAETCDGTPRNGPTVHALLSFSEYDRATGSNDYQAKPTVEETTLMGKINRLSTGHSEGAFRGRTPPPYLRVPILEQAWHIMRKGSPWRYAEAANQGEAAAC